MEIVIVGYGRMGRQIEEIATSRGHTIAGRVDPLDPGADHRDLGGAQERGILRSGTVVIEFALPEGIGERVGAYARVGAPAVIGTTGWDDQREAILTESRESGASVVTGSNFSVGANMFVRIAAEASRLAAQAECYDVGVVELHHRGKQDSPSGTALMIAEAIQGAFTGKSRVQTETLHRRIEGDELHVASGRIGSIPGTHTVYLDGAPDTVELTHRARTRAGFAEGAVRAAEWLVDNPGIHGVDRFFDEMFGKHG